MDYPNVALPNGGAQAPLSEREYLDGQVYGVVDLPVVRAAVAPTNCCVCGLTIDEDRRRYFVNTCAKHKGR